MYVSSRTIHIIVVLDRGRFIVKSRKLRLYLCPEKVRLRTGPEEGVGVFIVLYRISRVGLALCHRSLGLTV